MASRAAARVMIAGGGTGGHLFPALALAQEFEKRRQTEILFVGTSYGIENKLLPKTHYTFKKIWIRGLERKVSAGNLLFPIRLLVSLVQCAYFMIAFRPKVVIGTGGYVSGPALIMGVAFRIPTVIQEQNSFPGLVNRLLGKWVRQVHVTYEASLPYFRRAKETFVSGNPIRGAHDRIDRQNALQKFGLTPNRTTLFVFGGSQGARAINQLMLESIERLLARSDLQILWATGAADFDMVSAKCQHITDRLALHSFIEDMGTAYSAADIALCRAGASTLSELSVWGVPALLVPFPHATAGHQEYNARTMEKEGAAITIPEDSLEEQDLIAIVHELVINPDRRTKMSEAALRLARPQAASEIVDKIEPMIDE